VPALVFLLRDPYRQNRFVKFHSVQCLIFWVVGAVLALALRLFGMLVFFIPMVGPLLVVIVDVAALMAAVLLWLVLSVKALQGEIFMLPWIGAVAERYSYPAD